MWITQLKGFKVLLHFAFELLEQPLLYLWKERSWIPVLNIVVHVYHAPILVLLLLHWGRDIV